MLPAFVIGLREGLETIVILGAIVVFLRSQGRFDLLPRIWRATGVATGLCIATALILRLVEINLGWRQQEQLETIVGVIAIVMVTYMVLWMRRFPKDLANDSTSAATQALSRDSDRALVALAFFAVLREGFEIVVFVLATIGLTGDNSSLAAGGAVLGIIVAIGIGIGIVRGSRHLNVARFFRATAFILVLSTAGIAMTTAHSANAAGWIAFGQTPQYDISWLAPPGSVLSSVTTGMFGLEPYPVLIEIIAWLAYFVPMTLVVLWPRRTRSNVAAQAIPSETNVPLERPPRRLPLWVIIGSAGVIVIGGTVGGIVATTRSGGGNPTPVTNSSRVLYATLESVVCPTTDCIAVGEYLPTDKDAATGDPDGDGRATHTLIEMRERGSWQKIPSPDAGKGGSILFSISCTSIEHCVAVGSYKRAADGADTAAAPPTYPLIETYNGKSWQVVPSPGIAPNSSLSSVSCPTTTECIAVGATAKTSASGTETESLFIEQSNGKRWQVMPVPALSSTSSGLTSVACSSTVACVAVGEVAPPHNPSATRPLILNLSAGGWQDVALPSGSNGLGILYDVTCPTTSHCIAVGNSVALRSSGSGLIVDSNNGIWSTDTSVLSEKGDTTLNAVGCADASNCVVSGSTLFALDDAPVKIAARINNGNWVALDPANDDGSVMGLSCSTLQCVGVGSRSINVFGNTAAFVASLTASTWQTAHIGVP